jgi:hypothetical protein
MISLDSDTCFVSGFLKSREKLLEEKKKKEEQDKEQQGGPGGAKARL